MSIAADNMVQAYGHLISTLANNCIPLPREIILDLKSFMLLVEGHGGARFKPIMHTEKGWAVSCNYSAGTVLFRMDPTLIPAPK